MYYFQREQIYAVVDFSDGRCGSGVRRIRHSRTTGTVRDRGLHLSRSHIHCSVTNFRWVPMGSASGFRPILLGFLGDPLRETETLEAAGPTLRPDCERDQSAASCGRRYALLHAHLSRNPLAVELQARYCNHQGQNFRPSSEPYATGRTETGWNSRLLMEAGD